MTKVLDSFLFTHEFDLLEVRLRTLWPVVDKFLLMEGDHNFTNQPKEMRFNEQKDRFAWAKDKLIHIQHIGPFKHGPGDLFIEHQHRQYLYEQAKSIPGFEENDILLLSDVDEIPSREAINGLHGDFVSPLLFHQEFYYYNIKCHRGKKWHGTMAMRFGYDLGNVGEARAKRNAMTFIKGQCGWHLAHFYDSEGIREKLRHSSHRYYNDPMYHSDEHLAKCVKNNKSYLGKADGDTPPEPVPDYLMDELKKFPLFMGEEWR